MRSYRMGLFLIAVSSGLVLFASARTWVTVAYVEQGFPSVTMNFSGRQLDPLSAALGVAGLAGVLGIVSVRGNVRRFFGVLESLLGVGVFVSSFSASRVQGNAEVVGRLVAERLGRTVDAFHVTLSVWPQISMGTALVLVFGGGLVAVKAPRGTGMSQRYERAPEEKDLTTWQALDRGIDPTA